MNGRIGFLLEKYAETIEEHPVKVLGVALLVSMVLAAGASKVQTEEMSQEDILPDSIPVMAAYDRISQDFASNSGTSYTILVETDPDYANSSEIRDLRDPEALRFFRSVSNDLRKIDEIRTVSGPSGLFRDIPSSKSGVRKALNRLGKPRWSNYISGDYSAAKIEISTYDLTEKEKTEIADLIRQTVKVHDSPAGLKFTYTGQPYIDQAFQNQTQKTMQLTGLAAILGVIAVVVILFRSLFYGGTSLLALIFGIATGFGIFGYLGLNMSPATSGALTMGIGVAIDFGIQPIARYIEEREELEIEEALEETVKGVATPMTVGLIAANIGFLSLNIGKITFLSDLGTLLTLTTTMAYVAAFTVIPASLVIYDRYFTYGTQNFTLGKILPENSTRGEPQQ
ncbi:MAG: MMPL family transporter [Candidatus Nanohaloarchaea archaeon]